MQASIRLVPLVLAGSLCLIACTAKIEPEPGEPCHREGQESVCASVGPDPCGPCGGHWLYCQSGRWIPIHCDPQSPPPVDARPDAAVDARDAAEGKPSVDGSGPIDTPALDENDSPADGA